MTIAFCNDSLDANLSNALALPSEVWNDDSCYILVRTNNATSINLLKQSGRYNNLFPFGMDSQLPFEPSDLIRMAQLVNYSYSNMREADSEEQRLGITPMIVATELPEVHELDLLWNKTDKGGCPKLNTASRWSNIYNALTITTKMRSIGIDTSKWGDLFSMTNRDIEILSEVEHNRWCVEKLILGFVPTTHDEHQEILADITKRNVYKKEQKHDDIRNFHELGVDDTGLSVVRYDVGLTRSIPLIAYAYKKMNNGHC